jgi:hypothetical protein
MERQQIPLFKILETFAVNYTLIQVFGNGGPGLYIYVKLGENCQFVTDCRHSS